MQQSLDQHRNIEPFTAHLDQRKRIDDPNQRLKAATLRRHNSAGIQSLGEGTTPLMRAAYSGDVPLMHVLLDRGADPKLTQKNGIYPMTATFTL